MGRVRHEAKAAKEMRAKATEAPFPRRLRSSRIDTTRSAVVRDDKIPLAASGIIETMKKLWPDAWGVRMERVLRNSLCALLERDGATVHRHPAPLCGRGV